MIDASTIAIVLDVYRPERDALLELLQGIEPADWERPTECPAYTVHGIATHILGDDLSLLSRQRDAAPSGLIATAAEMPGADFRSILDAFNDQWVRAARFLSPPLLVALLRLTGEWTAAYYETVDPEAPGEPVPLFGAHGGTSPFWHAIARELMERWVHHSQIRRALGHDSLAADPFLRVGAEIAATMVGVEARGPEGSEGAWSLGAVTLGPAAQAAQMLTKGCTADEIRALASGPADAVAVLARFAGR